MSGVIAGIAVQAASTAASFIQAGQQRRKQQDFEADAARALAEARKKLQVNYAEAMSINKEPYNQERLAMLNAGAQITQAAAESERGAAAAAGRILASQQTAQADIANRQGLDMQNIQNAILEEESRLRDVNVGLDVQEIAGQQQAAADARLAADMAKQQGIQGIGNTVAAGLQLIPLYGGLGKKDTTTPVAPTPAENVAAPVSNMPSTTPAAQLPNMDVLPTNSFASAEEADMLGYVLDPALNMYVKKTTTNMNLPPEKRAFNTSTTPSYDAFNINLEGK